MDSTNSFVGCIFLVHTKMLRKPMQQLNLHFFHDFGLFPLPDVLEVGTERQPVSEEFLRRQVLATLGSFTQVEKVEGLVEPLD